MGKTKTFSDFLLGGGKIGPWMTAFSYGTAYFSAVVFMGVFTAVYLVMGGYKSMAVIDMFFGMVMTVGVIMLLYFILSRAEGIGNITRGLSEINPRLTAVVGPPGIWPLFSLVFLTSVAPFAMPQLIQKFYAIRDKESIRTGMIASTVFALLVGGIAYFVGSTTRFYINPETAPAVFQNGSLNVDALMPDL